MFNIPNQSDAGFSRQAGWHSSDVDAIAIGLAGDGVLAGLGVVSLLTPGMGVIVSAGSARVFGYFPYLAQTNLSIQAADPVQPRFDLVCLDCNGILSVVSGVAAPVPVAPAATLNSITLAQVYVPPGVTEILAWYLIDKRVVIPDPFDMYDEFVSGAKTTSGDISLLRWGYSSNGTPGLSFLTGSHGHPGQLSISSGSVNGDDTRLHLGSSTTADFIMPQDIARVRAIVQITSALSTMRFKFGVGQDISDVASDSFGISGAWFEFNSNDSPNLQTETRDVSITQTHTDTQAVLQNTWYQLDIVRLLNGNWQFARNGALLFTHDQNLPTFDLLPGFVIETNAPAARAFTLDFFGLNFAPLGDRWT